MKRTFITITNAHFYNTIKEDASQGETNWTVNKSTKAGDTILLYVCAPVSAIVATGTASIDSWREDDLNSPWYGSYMTDIHGLELLTRPITRANLLKEFPAWGYWKQPRICVAVKPEYTKRLEEMVAEAKLDDTLKWEAIAKQGHQAYKEARFGTMLPDLIPYVTDAIDWERLPEWIRRAKIAEAKFIYELGMAARS